MQNILIVNTTIFLNVFNNNSKNGKTAKACFLDLS